MGVEVTHHENSVCVFDGHVVQNAGVDEGEQVSVSFYPSEWWR